MSVLLNSPAVGAPRSPLVLACSGVASGIAPAATWSNATGAFVLGTALQTTYSDGIWLYFSGIGVAGSAGGPATSGMYWCVMSSPTAGQAYALSVDLAAPFLPYTPAVLPSLLATTAGAHTPTTGEYFGLANVTVPGGTLGKNGVLSGRDVLLVSNSATSKNVLATFDNQTLVRNNAGALIGPVLIVRREWSFYTLGSDQKGLSQSNIYLVGMAGASIFGTIDTTVNKSLKIIAQLTAVTDYIILQNFYAEVLR